MGCEIKYVKKNSWQSFVAFLVELINICMMLQHVLTEWREFASKEYEIFFIDVNGDEGQTKAQKLQLCVQKNLSKLQIHTLDYFIDSDSLRNLSVLMMYLLSSMSDELWQGCRYRFEGFHSDSYFIISAALPGRWGRLSKFIKAGNSIKTT